jgi:protein-L-isoaspartate O-methyltransferase
MFDPAQITRERTRRCADTDLITACPYGQRFCVEAPHPFITCDRLRTEPEPRPGERVLEVGPGAGYYSLDVADWIHPGGRLDIFDLQQEMLDHTMRRARERGLTNITPTRGDARELPYPEATFDAAFPTTVLGEIPDQDAALRGRLRRQAEAAGLAFDRRSGTPLGYFARFDRPQP